MASTRPVPQLGLMGFVHDLKGKISLAFMHALQADASQSTLYEGQVMSFQYVQSQSNTDPEAHAEALQVALQAYLSRYCDTVEAEVSVDNNEDAARYTLNIDITVTEGESYASLGAALLVDPLAMTATLIKENML